MKDFFKLKNKSKTRKGPTAVFSESAASDESLGYFQPTLRVGFSRTCVQRGRCPGLEELPGLPPVHHAESENKTRNQHGLTEAFGLLNLLTFFHDTFARFKPQSLHLRPPG